MSEEIKKTDAEASETKDKAVKEKKTINFTGKRKVFYIISSLLIIISIAASFFGVKIAIEFKGGTMISYSFTGEIDSNAVANDIKEKTGLLANVQQGDMFQSDNKKLVISISEGIPAETQNIIKDSLTEKYPDNNLLILDSTGVAASSGTNFFVKCIVAAAFASLILIIYIAVRFKKISGWSSGLCAVMALLHDIIITYGAYIIIGFEINANFIAVVLTILGCSINNTIVVYDRIRENRKIMGSASIDELVNVSTTQSITRSIRTSITTVSTMIIISIVAKMSGVENILSFSIPISIGMTVGTYSSMCLAPCLWVSMNAKKNAKKEAKA